MSINPINSNADAASLFLQQTAEARVKAESAQQENAQGASGAVATSKVASNNSAAEASPVNFSGITASQDKIGADEVTGSNVAQAQGNVQGLPGLTAATEAASGNSSPVKVPVTNTVAGEVRANAVTASDMAQMQNYASGLSGLAAITNVAYANSDVESSLVDFSDIKIFLAKVEAGTVTESDMAQMQESLSRIDAQHGSHPQHHEKQTTDSSEDLAQLLLDALFGANSLSGSSNTDIPARTLLDDMAQMGASKESKTTSGQTGAQANEDNIKNINKQMLSDMIHAYISSPGKSIMQELKA